ncbi:hypothetical protein VTN02DRAFT_5489 [Thermoascus thermophilus]
MAGQKKDEKEVRDDERERGKERPKAKSKRGRAVGKRKGGTVLRPVRRPQGKAVRAASRTVSVSQRQPAIGPASGDTKTPSRPPFPRAERRGQSSERQASAAGLRGGCDQSSCAPRSQRRLLMCAFTTLRDVDGPFQAVGVFALAQRWPLWLAGPTL